MASTVEAKIPGNFKKEDHRYPRKQILKKVCVVKNHYARKDTRENSLER